MDGIRTTATQPKFSGYVKFLRGSVDAYNQLKTNDKIDQDTLYFTYDGDTDTGTLYLGTRLIAGGSSAALMEKLSDISDVNLPENISDKTLLLYNSSTQTWGPITIDTLASQILTATVAVMTGASETTDGEKGLVPQPKKGDQDSVLFGNGTWKKVPIMQPPTETNPGIAGLVPPAHANTLNSFLRSDGTWASISVGNLDVMVGASSTEAGKSGLVPIPQIGEHNFFLRGDGTWAEMVGSITVEDLNAIHQVLGLKETVSNLSISVETIGDNVTDLTERVETIETILTWQELENKIESL